MDFQMLNRRQLQTLCKKNKIPANTTNLAMADALSALPIVQGMEELSIESPAGAQLITTTTSLAGATSTNTITTTTRRTKSFKHESDENLQPSTTRITRRSTRRDVHRGDRTPVTCLKMDTLHFNDIEVEDKEDANIDKVTDNLSHHTPAVVPTSRQRAALTLKGGETAQTKVQGTRRSTRLAVKNKQGNNTNDLISETALKMDFGEIMEINVKGQCSADADVDSVAESVGVIDLNKKSEEGVGKGNIVAVVSDTKSDCSAYKHSKSGTGFNEDSGQDSEVVESKMIVDRDGAVGIMCNNVPNDGNSSKTENSFESGGELDSKDVAAEDVEEIHMDHLEDAFFVDDGIDLNMSKEEVESKQDFGPSHCMEMFQTETKNVVEDGIVLDGEKEVESGDCAAENQDDAEKGMNLEDLNPLRIHVAALERDDESADTEIEPKTEEPDVGIIEPAIEPKDEKSNYLVEEAVENNLAEKFNDRELNTSYSEHELSWVEDDDFGLEPSTAVEEGLTKDLTGGPAVPVNSATLEQLDVDNGVVEIQANSCVECATKTQDASAVDLTTPNVTAGDIADLSSGLTVDSNENLSNLGVGGVTDVTQLFVGRMNYLSPVKASSPSPRKKIPLQKSVSSKTPTSGKRMMLVSDDKENMDESGTEVAITSTATDKNEKKEICMENTSQKPCWDEASLRMLKKALKTKLERANQNVKAASSARPALHPLTENRLVSNSQ